MAIINNREYLSYFEFDKTFRMMREDGDIIVEGEVDEREAYIWRNGGGCMLACLFKDDNEYREF